jgi:precorrin-6x reductase
LIAVFAGTQEGREVLERLKALNLPIFGSTATPYGCELIKNYENLELNASPMNRCEMKSWLSENKIRVVIDATHPYANEVTANIAKACEGLHLPLARLQRSWVSMDSVKRFANYEDCISYLQTGTGKILLTTGSNHLEKFVESLPKERLIVRVLPRANVLEKCEKIGLKANQILAIQGPFSYGMNQAMMKDFQISQMVTKESGTIGGFQEKVRAAQDMNVEVLSIMNKSEETNFATESQDELLNWVQVQIQDKGELI